MFMRAKGLAEMVAIRFANSRLWAVVPLCAFALALPGCSTVSDLAGMSRPGYQNDGSYVLSAQDEGLGCRALHERSQGLQAQMQALSQRAVEQVQQVPTTISSAWGRLFGAPGDGVPAVAQYNEARAEEAALNATLARKGCSTGETASIKR
jgi:hypothetical protein